LNAELTAEGITDRISKYEQLVTPLAAVTACITYWGKDPHRRVLEKAFSRSTERLERTAGPQAWSSLRWYPTMIMLYSAGIAGVEAENYHALSQIFQARVPVDEYKPEATFLDVIDEGVLSLVRSDIFKRIPGYERRHTPFSDHLFKVLQPTLDAALFIGKSYEQSFDKFEVLLHLLVMDRRTKLGASPWGPVGRFGWKNWNDASPLKQFAREVDDKKVAWGGLRVGMFGGDLQRLKAVISEAQSIQAQLHWH
jgi:hypothetical protein